MHDRIEQSGATRRAVLTAGAGLAVLGPSVASAQPRVRRDRPRGGAHPKNIILLVSDGMSTGTLTLADELHRLKHNTPSRWYRLWERPDARLAMQRTTSANGLVTDSAAAGSAWGIGEKVDNRAINTTPDGRSPEPILVRARRAGRATGLVTTTRVTHATPAAFIANVPSRNLEADIARQMLDRRVDVVLGGGARHFDDDTLAAAPDVRLVRTRAELAAAADHDGRLLGLFTDSHMHYELDRVAAHADSEPSIAEMTAVALRKLDANDGGFVLQVEGGRVDHGAHANDAGGMLYDQLAFDAAIGVVEDWLGDRDDTLVVVTTDHANANPGQTFYADTGVRAFAKTLGFRRSFGWILGQLDPDERGAPTSEAITRVVREATGITLEADEADMVVRSYARDRVDPFLTANAPHCVLGSVLANHHGIAFVSPNHTADLVEVTAFGAGAAALPKFIENADLGKMLIEAASRPATRRN